MCDMTQQHVNTSCGVGDNNQDGHAEIKEQPCCPRLFFGVNAACFSSRWLCVYIEINFIWLNQKPWLRTWDGTFVSIHLFWRFIHITWSITTILKFQSQDIRKVETERINECKLGHNCGRGLTGKINKCKFDDSGHDGEHQKNNQTNSRICICKPRNRNPSRLFLLHLYTSITAGGQEYSKHSNAFKDVKVFSRCSFGSFELSLNSPCHRTYGRHSCCSSAWDHAQPLLQTPRALPWDSARGMVRTNYKHAFLAILYRLHSIDNAAHSQDSILPSTRRSLKVWQWLLKNLDCAPLAINTLTWTMPGELKNVMLQATWLQTQNVFLRELQVNLNCT